MKRLLHIFALALVVPAIVPDQAYAQDDVENLDEDPAERRRDRQSRRAALEGEVIREIERGYYLKSDVGSALYFLNYGGTLFAGTSLGFAFGSDFLDQERRSASWEIAFVQGVHNGLEYDRQSFGNPAMYIQGDTRTFALHATVEYSGYASRRFGIGVRAGAGIMLTPLLINSDAFTSEVEPTWGVTTTVHRNPHPLVSVGPTFEYYTKLSHFSIGADVDVMYALGFDLGMDATGYLKYTF